MFISAFVNSVALLHHRSRTKLVAPDGPRRLIMGSVGFCCSVLHFTGILGLHAALSEWVHVGYWSGKLDPGLMH